ncbi:short-chain dehydrogenase/reductase SDR [Tanacetum coccineum]|uniref:Short-chain dehydrogenase/reductase SDR n=1 Tax=Tanacetum coccineum TaxID=301880 RepID=A0ABQ5J270_9ASTR
MDFKAAKLHENGWPLTMSAYKVSKAALNAYTRLTAKKFPNIIVNCVHPGYVVTDMTSQTGFITVEDGAKGPVMAALLPNDGPSGNRDFPPQDTFSHDKDPLNDKVSEMTEDSSDYMIKLSILVDQLKRCAVVTGANRGIGLEICRQLATKGVEVILTARNESRGLEAVENLNISGLSNVIFHQLDINDSTSIACLAKFIETRFKKLDILLGSDSQKPKAHVLVLLKRWSEVALKI